MDSNYTDIKRYVEEYYRGALEPGQKKQFEDKIISDPVFAEEVAFYLSTIASAKEIRQEETRERFKELYKQSENIEQKKKWNSKPLYRPIAVAATVILIGLSSYYFFFNGKNNTEELANTYINTHLLILSQSMGAGKDTMQMAIEYYNKIMYDSALYFLESVNKTNPDYSEAIKNIGLVYLAEKNYEKALLQFDELTNTNGAYSKRGIVLKAVTLMARNKPGDKQQAKVLLRQVVQQKIDGYEQAEEWLKKF